MVRTNLVTAKIELSKQKTIEQGKNKNPLLKQSGCYLVFLCLVRG